MRNHKDGFVKIFARTIALPVTLDLHLDELARTFTVYPSLSVHVPGQAAAPARPPGTTPSGLHAGPGGDRASVAVRVRRFWFRWWQHGWFPGLS
jgi:hypothetical protein